MPVKINDSPNTLSSPLSDSVDLGNFPIPTPLVSAGWLDAVHSARPPTARPPAVASGASNTCAAAPLRLSSAAGKTHAQRRARNEHTPTASRNSAEMSAMLSPIPVNADDSDVPIQQLLSPVEKMTRPGNYSTSKSLARGSTATPAPPSARTQLNAHRSTSAPSRQASWDPFPAKFASEAMPAPPTTTVLPPPPVASQQTPIGDSHVAAANTLSTTAQLHSDDDTIAFTDGSPQRHDQQSTTPYSSALMQALSRTEGAAALTSPWASATQRGGPSAYYSEGDTGNGSSSDVPPDMYVEAMKAKVAKQQWMALERARQEVLEEARRRRDCPFAPQVSRYAARIQRPASLRPENRFSAEMIRRKQWVAKRQQEEVERELQSCTFRPLTLRTAQLDPTAIESPRAATTVFHDLYAEAENRRAFEHDVKPQLVHQLEERRRSSPAPLRPGQLAEVVERLCARGVVRSGVGAAQQKDNTDGAPYEGSARSVECPGVPPDVHHPTLSLETKRIVAAQVASGERDGNIVKQLYRHSEQGVVRGQLKRELDREQERLARAEEAIALAQERKRLQQEYYRSVLVAKFRALARHVASAQHCPYRTTAPQSVVQVARAALDILSTEEAEELLGAVEHCGRHRLTEDEFVAVVFRYLAEQEATPVQSALLRNAPPPLRVFRRAASAATLKRADSAPGAAASAESSPSALPRVKREKPDPEVIGQVRARRAQQLAEWTKESQRQRPITDGVLADGADYTFQPAPRRLIPYACRPDMTVPVKSTKSEMLRRAHLSARMYGIAPALGVDSMARPLSAQRLTPSRTTTRELFSRGTLNPASLWTRERSRSAAARSEAPTAPEGGAAALTSTVSGPVVTPRATFSRPCAGPAQALSASPASRKAPAEAELQCHSYVATLAGRSAAAPRQRASTSKGYPSTLAARHPCASSCHGRGNLLTASPSLAEQIMHSTPEDRARLGHELLLRQIREHQRRSAA
nr:unnamed protein product [Leishmania braziliensis]